MDENENASQTEDLWQSDDWADLRWAREHSTPQQIARHLLDPQWRGRDYNALDELVEMTHDADLSALDEDDLTALASSELPELRQAVIRHPGTPDRILEDMARKESNTRLLQMLADSGNSASGPSTCAAGTSPTNGWPHACFPKRRTGSSTVFPNATSGRQGGLPSNRDVSTIHVWKA